MPHQYLIKLYFNSPSGIEIDCNGTLIIHPDQSWEMLYLISYENSVETYLIGINSNNLEQGHLNREDFIDQVRKFRKQMEPCLKQFRTIFKICRDRIYPEQIDKMINGIAEDTGIYLNISEILEKFLLVLTVPLHDFKENQGSIQMLVYNRVNGQLL